MTPTAEAIRKIMEAHPDMCEEARELMEAAIRCESGEPITLPDYEIAVQE